MNRRTGIATGGLAVPALIALGVSTYTSYLYFGERLGITGWERIPLCAGGEAGILALSIYSWATGRRGPALMAYGLVLVQGIPAFSLSGEPGGLVRIALGPVMLAVLLHLLLGLEVRMSGARRDGLLSAALREVRERLTAYLGIGRRGADSAAIARSRAADRAVKYATRAEPRTARGRARRTARVAHAVDAALHGLDDAQRAEAERVIVARIDRHNSVTALWSEAAPYQWRATTRDDAHGAEHDAHEDAQTEAAPAEADDAPAPMYVSAQVDGPRVSTHRAESRLTVVSPEAAPRGMVTRLVNDAVRDGVRDTASIKARLDAHGVSAHPGTIRKARAAALSRLENDAHGAGGYA